MEKRNEERKEEEEEVKGGWRGWRKRGEQRMSSKSEINRGGKKKIGQQRRKAEREEKKGGKRKKVKMGRVSHRLRGLEQTHQLTVTTFPNNHR